jgi:hypothetical protein
VNPFRVICETCRSRLKVRSAEAIGEIHPCPKCGSMVLIVPPADWIAGPAAPMAAAAAGRPTEPAVTLSSSASTVLPADFAIELPVAPAANVAPAEVAITPQLEAQVPAESAAGISPVVWCAIGGAALFVITGLTYVLWPRGEKQMATPAVAATAVPPQPAANTKLETNPATATDQQPVTEPDPYAVDHSNNAPVAITTAKPVEALANAASATPPTDEPKPAAATVSLSELGAPPTAVSPPADSPPASAIVTDAAPAGSASASSTGGGHVLKIDPLDFDPERMSLSPGPAPVATNSIPPEATPDAPTNATAEGSTLPAHADLQPPPAEHRAINVRRGPVASDAPRTLDSATLLAVQIPSLHLAEMPLARFVETLSELSGVPITLDPIALEQNGMSSRIAVSATAANTTLDNFLRDALAARRLVLVERDGQASVTLANSDERRAAAFEVKDLVDGADAGNIAKLIERFVAPGTWNTVGGPGSMQVDGTTLHINQSLAVRREALIFCERLRRARGLPLRSKYPAELLTIESPYAKLAPSLARSATFTFMAGTRLADVVHAWQELSGLAILVDWSALAEIEFAPVSPLACSAVDRPWAEALDGVLGPLGLAWWAVDGETLQITSIDALQRIERVEFYTIPKSWGDQFASSDKLVESLQKEIAARPHPVGDPGDVRIALDMPSGRLIVRATPDVQRFLSERLLRAE